MAVQFDPIAKDESLNTTEQAQRNIADVLAQELSGIATAISGGGGGSGGHTIKNSSGTALPQRTNLQFGSGLGVTDDAVNDATVVELTGESVHANMFTKLWENPDPSALFTPQTITLASDEYDFLLMIYRRSGIYADAEGIIVPKGTNATLSYANTTGSGAESRTRTVVRNSDTSYAFGDAYEASGTTARTVNNNRIVPTVIYGFKKSLDITAIVSNVSTDATRCIMSDGVTNVEDAVEEKARKTDIATVESGSTASRAYSVGELVYVNGNLYKVITAISSGATFTVGTNIQSAMVGDALVKKENITVSFSSGKTGNITSLADKDIISAQLLGSIVFFSANVSGGVRAGYAFVVANSNLQVNTSLNGNQTVTIFYKP